MHRKNPSNLVPGNKQVVIYKHANSRGGLTTTLKGSMYQELPSELVTQIKKVPPVAAQRDGRKYFEHWRTSQS